MIIVDTSIWVEHFRRRHKTLVTLLEEDQVLIHPFIIGELSLGGLIHRDELINLLQQLPTAIMSNHQEVLHAITTHNLDGKGIGWIDAHLFTSALLSHAQLWTIDKQLNVICIRNKINFSGLY
ncbi:MAG: VapC toxin family PIN domain ribonuclease [Deltaproteobacteria bacterium]|nr:VapC toxin family PIN domain ribonuclease [Deltaproteobacteria bacterium]